MARFFPLEQTNLNSPKGFWPHPGEEQFYRLQTPWRVPMKRKSRGRSSYYYDHKLESVQYKKCEEVITCNRFQILTEEDSTSTKTSPQEDMISKEEDNLLFQQEIESEHIYPTGVTEFSESNSLNKFMLTDNMYPNNNNFYMYKSNKKFCSGYFPDFITLNDPMYYQLSNNNNHNFYYLKTQNGKYLKYLSNKSSKYDNLYFNNMVDAYRISRIHSNRSLISNNPRILSNKKKF